MKKYLIILALLTVSVTYSQDWELILEQGNDTYYYKPNTDKTAWIKIISPQTEYLPTKTSQKTKIVDGHILILWKYDCRSKKMGVIQSTVYSKDGQVLKSEKEIDVLVAMDYVNPDSIGEGLLKIFCDLK